MVDESEDEEEEEVLVREFEEFNSPSKKKMRAEQKRIVAIINTTNTGTDYEKLSKKSMDVMSRFEGLFHFSVFQFSQFQFF